MRHFLKQRTRVLVICSDPQVQNTLVSLLTGFEFYVDYANNVSDALTRFKAYRHPVILLDETLVEVSAQRLVDLFRLVQRDCLVMAIAQPGQSHELLHRIDEGLFDIVELPIQSRDLQFRVRRLLKHHQITSSLNFMRVMALGVLLLLPLLIAFAWYHK